MTKPFKGNICDILKYKKTNDMQVSSCKTTHDLTVLPHSEYVAFE